MAGPGDAGDVVVVLASDPASVPLIRGSDDPAVLVPTYLGDGQRTLARLDLSTDGRTRIGELLRIRAGVPEPRGGRVELPVVQIGELRVDGLTAVEVAGDQLVLALADLPNVGVWVRSSDGRVDFVSAASARALLHEPTVGTLSPWSWVAGPVEAPWADVLVDPSSHQMATRAALHPSFTDAARWWSAHLRDDALFGGPVAGPDWLDALRWGRVGPHAFAAGDLAHLAEADGNLWVAGSEDCVALGAVAERAVRVGDVARTSSRFDAAIAWEAWRRLSPGQRERLRGAGEGQSDECAIGGRFAGGEPWDPADPWPTARRAWTERDASAARFALEHGADTPALRLVLLDHVLATGTTEAATAAARAVTGDGPHALTRALAVADRLSLEPATMAERVARGLPLDLDAWGEAWARRPGDPDLRCLAAAADPSSLVPELPAADCLAATVVRALAAGDAPAEAEARAALARRWPDVWLPVTR